MAVADCCAETVDEGDVVFFTNESDADFFGERECDVRLMCTVMELFDEGVRVGVFGGVMLGGVMVCVDVSTTSSVGGSVRDLDRAGCVRDAERDRHFDSVGAVREACMEYESDCECDTDANIGVALLVLVTGCDTEAVGVAMWVRDGGVTVELMEREAVGNQEMVRLMERRAGE